VHEILYQWGAQAVYRCGSMSLAQMREPVFVLAEAASSRAGARRER
jgi:hypothetical protein